MSEPIEVGCIYCDEIIFTTGVDGGPELGHVMTMRINAHMCDAKRAALEEAEAEPEVEPETYSIDAWVDTPETRAAWILAESRYYLFREWAKILTPVVFDDIDAMAAFFFNPNKRAIEWSEEQIMEVLEKGLS